MKVGDIGTVISLDTGQALTGGTNAVIRFYKPSGAVGEWSATVSGNTIQFTTVAGSLDEAGSYSLQGYVQLASWRGFTDQVKVEVGSALLAS